MPRLSLYRPTKSQDYEFFDRTISEMFTVGAVDIYLHKYLGTTDQGPSTDATQPRYDQLDPTNIQDLLWLENRDRKYSENIYRLRGHYNVQNLDFNLSQFGLFLTNDTIFITFHYNNMIDTVGRKLMVGDVLEMPHLTDYHPLNEDIPTSLRRYYQITDANYASEGFSPTWHYHLWRVKAEPLVDSQEFANILRRPTNTDNYLGDWEPTRTYPPGYTVSYGGKTWQNLTDTDIPVNTDPGYLVGDWNQDRSYNPTETVFYNGRWWINRSGGNIAAGTVPTGNPGNPWTLSPWTLDTAETLKDILSTYNENIRINNAVIEQAAQDVALSGYDRQQLYVVPTFEDGEPAPPINVVTTNSPPANARSSVVQISTRGGPVTAVRISAAAMSSIWDMTADADWDFDKFISMSLQAAEIAAPQTDSGSGALEGDLVLTVRAVSTVVSPYGTADNTFAEADEYPSITVTTTGIADINQQRITVTGELPVDVRPGLLVSAAIAIGAGGTVTPFQPNTRVMSVVSSTEFMVDLPLTAFIPAGTVITVASDFRGIDGVQPRDNVLTVLAESTVTTNSTTFIITDGFTDAEIPTVLNRPLIAPLGVFAAGTTIFSIDTLSDPEADVIRQQVVISQPTLSAMAAGTAITVDSTDPLTFMDYRADVDPRFQFIRRSSPRGFGYTNGYLAGTATAPNGEPVEAGITFPGRPQVGDYFLRTDYLPQQLFRFDGALWVRISDNVRTGLGFAEGDNNQSQLAGFINNGGRTATSSGQSVPERQSLSQVLRIRPD